MGLFEHWPYVNFHELNTNWLISKVKNIETAEANAAESAEAAAASAEASQQSAEASSESAAAAAEDASSLAGKAAQVDLNTARIDNILVQGTPTEGNAELIDIRVGYNGTTYTTAGDAVRGQIDLSLKNSTAYVTANNYSTVLPDANNAGANTVYMILGANVPVPNLPTTNFSDTGILTTYKADALKMQMLIHQNMLYHRGGYGDSWNAWQSVNLQDSYLKVMPAYVTAGNYSTVLPDANNAGVDTVYMILGANVPVPNLPITDFSDTGILTTYKSDALLMQILTYRGKTYERSGYNDSWNPWKVNQVKRERVLVGYGGQFSKLTDALDYAYDRGDCDVYVNYGTYDIISELGSDYLENWTFQDGEKGGGPVIGNNCHYYFSPNAFVRFNYTGSNTDIKGTFSPINAGNGSFELHGLNLEASNCKYAIHDEMTHYGINNRNITYHLYDMCQLYLNNSANDRMIVEYCIGGGLLSHGGELVTIQDSIFDGYANTPKVSYHNGLGGSNLGSASQLTFKGNYCKKGTVRLSSYGTNYDYVTKMIASNNKLQSAPINELENPSATLNTQIIEWNNVIE